jgi:hypothetical protein
MPVAEMRGRMSAEEYVQWGVYYARKAQAQELARLKAGG